MAFRTGTYSADSAASVPYQRLSKFDSYGETLGGIPGAAVGLSAQQTSSATVARRTTPATADALRPVEPKFKSLLDLEQNVDRHQAESLLLIRDAHRERHRLITSPREYFYRNLMLRKLIAPLLLQALQTLFVVSLWTYVAQFVDILFIHLYLTPPTSLLQSIREVFFPVVNLWTVLGSAFLSAGASWQYVRALHIPPPIYHNREQKLKDFMKSVSFSGTWILIYASILLCRPDLNQVEEATIEQDLNATLVDGGSMIDEKPIYFTELLLRILLSAVVPVLFVSLALLTVNLVQFWNGGFLLGTLQHSVINRHLVILQLLRNPVALYREIRNVLIELLEDRIYPVLTVPGSPFMVILSVLFFVPILVPVARLCRVWIYYHFLAFAFLHAWKLNLQTTKRSLLKMHNFGKLDFSDMIAIPTVVQDLRRTRWRWSEYFDLQFRGFVLSRLTNDSNLMRQYLAMRLTTRHLQHLDSFVQLWLRPIKDCVYHLQSALVLPPVMEERRSHYIEFVMWATTKLHLLFEMYGNDVVDPLGEYFDGSDFAQLVQPAVKIIDYVQILTQLVVRGKTCDARNILSAHYTSIVEQMAALAFVMDQIGNRFPDLTSVEASLVGDRQEVTVRFFIKCYRQLQRILPLHLSELLKIVDASSLELRFNQSPGLKNYMARFRPNSE